MWCCSLAGAGSSEPGPSRLRHLGSQLVQSSSTERCPNLVGFAFNWPSWAYDLCPCGYSCWPRLIDSCFPRFGQNWWILVSSLGFEWHIDFRWGRPQLTFQLSICKDHCPLSKPFRQARTSDQQDWSISEPAQTFGLAQRSPSCYSEASAMEPLDSAVLAHLPAHPCSTPVVECLSSFAYPWSMAISSDLSMLNYFRVGWPCALGRSPQLLSPFSWDYIDWRVWSLLSFLWSLISSSILIDRQGKYSQSPFWRLNTWPGLWNLSWSSSVRPSLVLICPCSPSEFG